MKDIAAAIRTKILAGTPPLASQGVFVGSANESPGATPLVIWTVLFMIGGTPIAYQETISSIRRIRMQISVFGRGGDGRREMNDAEVIRTKLLNQVWRDATADVWVQSVVAITEIAFIREDDPEAWHATQDLQISYV